MKRKYCINCGRKFSVMNKYCPQCGLLLSQPKKTGRILKKIGIAFIAIFMIGCVLSVFTDSIKEDDVIYAVNNSYQVSEEDRVFAENYSVTELSVLISDRISYEIEEYDSKEVTLTITAPNMRELFSQVTSEDAEYSDSYTEAIRIEDYIRTSLLEGNYTTVVNTITVELEKIDDKYEIVPTEEYVDALFGGMISYYNEIMNTGGVQ